MTKWCRKFPVGYSNEFSGYEIIPCGFVRNAIFQNNHDNVSVHGMKIEILYHIIVMTLYHHDLPGHNDCLRCQQWRQSWHHDNSHVSTSVITDNTSTSTDNHTTYHMMTSSNGNIFRVTGPLCGEFTGPGEFPAQRPVTRSFDVFFDLRLNKQLSKQSWGWWFETASCSLWRHCNDMSL